MDKLKALTEQLNTLEAERLNAVKFYNPQQLNEINKKMFAIRQEIKAIKRKHFEEALLEAHARRAERALNK